MRLRAAREAMGWTQQELADRLNTSASTISNLEREQHPPTVPEQVNQLTSVLPISTEDLLRDMGVVLSSPAAAKLPRSLVDLLLQLTPGEWMGVEIAAHGLLAVRDHRGNP